MIEKGFVRTVDPFRDILDRLTAQQLPMGILLPLFQLRKKHLEPVSGEELSIHPIVTAVKRNAVILDLRCNVDSTVQIAVMLAVVQLIFICHSYLHSKAAFPVNRTGLLCRLEWFRWKHHLQMQQSRTVPTRNCRIWNQSAPGDASGNVVPTAL